MNADEQHDAVYIARAVEALSQKWIAGILCQMQHGPVRLGQLTRTLPEASKKSLTANLRWLEKVGIVFRKDLSGVRLHVEYDMRDEVREPLVALLHSLAAWGATLPQENSLSESETGTDHRVKSGKPPRSTVPVDHDAHRDRTGATGQGNHPGPPVPSRK